MKKRMILTVALLLVVSVSAWRIYAHCEIPCGIYDDPLRMQLIMEHIATIGKSIHEIEHLQQDTKPNCHQLTRWTVNKEHHATELQNIVWQYFMTQRIKPVTDKDPGYDKYIKELTLLHQLTVGAMKSKQTLDPTTVTELKRVAVEFEMSYFGKKVTH